MPDSDEFWDLYWEMRLDALQNLGKKAAVLAASKLVRQLNQPPGKPVRLLELGCGEGQIIGSLVDGHAQATAISQSVGIDYVPAVVEKCRRTYPGANFMVGDFTDAGLLASLGQFEIVILVNALHEVYSATISEVTGEVDVPAAKTRVRQAFLSAASCAVPGGYLVLFDGLEPPLDPGLKVQIRFLTPQAAEYFNIFCQEYRPFRISPRFLGSSARVELSIRDFTRYITKSIFLGKGLWQTERFESYQYFTRDEFTQVFHDAGLTLVEMRTLTVDEEKWRRTVRIETPGVRFPEEHILIIGRRD